MPIYTDDEIRTLLANAYEHGDDELVDRCTWALQSREGAEDLYEYMWRLNELDEEYEAYMQDPEAGAMRPWPLR